MKNIILFLLLFSSFALFGQNPGPRVLSGFHPTDGRPGYKIPDTIRSLNLVDPLYKVNDSTIGINVSIVSSVTGTTNRITSTGGLNPVIDISGSYVGQSSITTLGTVTTGTWNGTALGTAYGGTNLTSYTTGDLLYASATNVLSKLAVGSAGQQLTVTGGLPAWGTASAGRISGLTAANATNSIDNVSYEQLWRWESLAGIGLNLQTNSTTAAGNNQKILNIVASGTNATSTQTTYNLFSSNGHAGTASTNVAGYFNAASATNNYALITENGNVGLGQPIPIAKVDISSGATTTGTYAFRLQSTMPTTMSGGTYGWLSTITGAGSSNQFNAAHRFQYNAGHTGANANTAVSVFNGTAGTGNDLQWATTQATPLGNTGVVGFSSQTTTGLTMGGFFEGAGGNLAIGAMGKSTNNKASATHIGVFGQGNNANATAPIQIGGFFTLGLAAPTYTSAAILIDNATTTSNILTARDNGTNVFEIQDAGKMVIAQTATAGGTTGAQTINKAVGSVNFAAAATTLVVTNSFASTTSQIFVQVYGTDVTANNATVTRASGSFTITLNAAATAETAVGFWVIN